MSTQSENKVSSPRLMRASEAANRVGYSADYVTRLAREKKITATQKGRQWFVDVDSLKFFALTAEAEKKRRAEELREERVLERARIIRTLHDETLQARVVASKPLALAETAIVVLLLFIFSNIVFVSYESKFDTNAFLLGVHVVVADISKKIIPEFENDRRQQAAISQTVTAQEVPIWQEPAPALSPEDIDYSEPESFDGIALFEQEVSEETIEAVRQSFSDEVDVEFDSVDSGIITPVFKERSGESFRFILVPVTPEKTIAPNHVSP